MKNIIKVLLLCAAIGYIAISFYEERQAIEMWEHSGGASEKLRIETRYIDDYNQWRHDLELAGLVPNDYPSLFWLHAIYQKELEEEVLGRSLRFQNEIVIDPDASKYGEWKERLIVYHELGHFVFGLEHGSCRIMMEVIDLENGRIKREWEELVTEYIETIKAVI